MRDLIKTLILLLVLLLVMFVLYYLFLFGVFSGMYNPRSKEIVYEQNTSLGLFSITLDTGDPLSSDSWEYRINDSLLRKDYVNMTSHTDSFYIGKNLLLLNVMRNVNNKGVSFALSSSINISDSHSHTPNLIKEEGGSLQ